LTSVLKNLTTAAEEVTLAAADGSFSNVPYVGTLDNGGVGIAPTHDWESRLDSALLAEVKQLQADIISGEWKVESVSSPK
jgi:basic membrane protein A